MSNTTGTTPIAECVTTVYPVFPPVDIRKVSRAVPISVRFADEPASRDGRYVQFDIVAAFENLTERVSALENENDDLTVRVFALEDETGRQRLQIESQQKQLDHQGRQLNVVRSETSQQCPYCSEKRIHELRVLYCGHVLCKGCIAGLPWCPFEDNKICPFDHNENGYVHHPITKSPCKCLRPDLEGLAEQGDTV